MYFYIEYIGNLPGLTNEFWQSMLFETGEFQRPKGVRALRIDDSKQNSYFIYDKCCSGNMLYILLFIFTEWLQGKAKLQSRKNR